MADLFVAAREARCGKKARVRSIGAVTFVFISEMIDASVELEASAKENDFWIPALMKTVSRSGWFWRMDEVACEMPARSEISHCCVWLAHLYRQCI